MITKITIGIISVVVALSIMPLQTVSAVTAADWKAGNIIEDSIFTNSNDMSVNQIQAFLNSKVPNCDTNGTQQSEFGGGTRAQYGAANNNPAPFTCLKDYYEVPKTAPGPAVPANNYGGKPIPSGAKSAARLIWDAAQQYDINPKVLLVKLGTESAGPLTSDDWPFKNQYKYAMGARCPDSGPGGSPNCDPDYSGFSIQIAEAAALMRYYLDNMDEPWWTYKKPDQNNFILWNVSETGCGGRDVFIENSATAALYTYTPYQPNAAALNNMYGTGNNCSAYGNRNFWRVYNDWFGSTRIPTVFKTTQSDQAYLFSGNEYFRINSTAMLNAYGFDKEDIGTIEPGTLTPLEDGGTLSNLTRFGGSNEIYLIDQGKRLQFPSRDMLTRYGYSIGQEIDLDPTLIGYTSAGPQVTEITKSSQPEIYLIDAGRKRHISSQPAYTTLGSPTYASRPVTSLSKSYLDSRAAGTPIVAPWSFVNNLSNKSLFWNGNDLQTIDSRTMSEINIATDYSASNVEMLDNTPLPTINQLIKDVDNTLYLINGREKITIQPAQLTNLGLSTDSFVPVVNGFVARLAAPTKIFAGAFRINNSNEVYVVKDGKRLHVTSIRALNEQGISLSQVINLSSRSAALFPADNKKILAQGQAFRVGTTAPIYIVNGPTTSLYVSSSQLLNAFGYRLKDVISLTVQQAASYPNSGNLYYFVKDGSNNIWAIDNGGYKRFVSTNASNASVFNINLNSIPFLSSTALGYIPTDSPLTSLIQVPGDSKVYKIENGLKRWVTSRAAFDRNGFVTSDIRRVTSGFKDVVTTGPPLY